MKDWRNKIILSGNKARSEVFIGLAQSQMEILKAEMAARGLSQGVRRVWLHDDVHVECSVCFNQFKCKIWTPVPTDIQEKMAGEETYLLVVTGDETRKIVLSNIDGSFESGEAVECGDDGYGTIESLSGSRLYGSFVHCFNGQLLGVDSKASGDIESCYRRHYADLYNHQELNQLTLGDPENEFNIFSALDNPPASDLACSDLTKAIRREWTKVYDKFTLGVFTYIDLDGFAIEKWGVTASYKGRPITWASDTWFGPFIREVRRNLHEVVTGQGIDTHIGWDVWKTDDDFFCGLIGDQEETLHVFRLNRSTAEMETVFSYKSSVKWDYFFDESNPTQHEKYTRLLGYGYIQENDSHVLYWGQVGRNDPRYIVETVTYEDGVPAATFEEVYVPDDASFDPGDLAAALWNPVKRKLYPVFDSGIGEGNLGVLKCYIEVRCAYYYVAHPSAGFFCPVQFDGNEVLGNAGGGSWNCTGYVDTNGANACSIFIDFEGETYEFPAVCYTKGESYPFSYFFGTRYYIYRYTLGSQTYYGRMLIDDEYLSKGQSVVYAKTAMYSSVQSWETDNSCCAEIGGGMYPEVQTGGNTFECQPYGVVRYEFQKWIWMNNLMGHAYELSKDHMTTEPYEDNGITGLNCVWAGDWQPVQGGNTDMLKAASGWPYDYGWTSILLSGEDRSGNNWSGSVIYKDLVGDEGFFLVDQNMKHYPIGQYDRAFFTLHTEDEVING